MGSGPQSPTGGGSGGELVKTGRINEVARMVFEQKAADHVIATAKIEEVPADKWNEILIAEQDGAAAKKKTTTKKTTTKKTTKKTPTKKS